MSKIWIKCLRSAAAMPRVVQRGRSNVTPTAVADRLASLVPGFADHWARGDSLFVDEGGGFTSHGVFSGCSHFVREHFGSLPVASVQELAAFLSECLEGTYGEDIDNAAATCFLENLAGEPFHRQLALCLRPAARKFYDGVIGV